MKVEGPDDGAQSNVVVETPVLVPLQGESMQVSAQDEPSGAKGASDNGKGAPGVADPSAQVSLGQEEEEPVRRGRAPTRILPGDQDGPLVRPRASSRDAAGVWRDMRERERLIEQERILVRGIVSEICAMEISL